MAVRTILITILASAAIALSTKTQDACASIWDRCGGQGWEGPGCCSTGGTCTNINAWYSQCLPVTTFGNLPLENSLEDERIFRQLSFKWTIAWDRKDRETWLAITGSQVVADYTDYPAVGRLTVASPGYIFNSSFTLANLGDKRLETQHLLGSVLFTRTNATVAKGEWQVRARHVRDFHNGTVTHWDSSSFLEFTFEKMNHTWVIVGLRPHTVVATTGRPEDVIGIFNYTA